MVIEKEHGFFGFKTDLKQIFRFYFKLKKRFRINAKPFLIKKSRQILF